MRSAVSKRFLLNTKHFLLIKKECMLNTNMLNTKHSLLNTEHSLLNLKHFLLNTKDANASHAASAEVPPTRKVKSSADQHVCVVLCSKLQCSHT